MLPNWPSTLSAGHILPASRPPSRSAPPLNPIAPASRPVPNFPRLRALALFGRRSVERAEPPCCRRPKTSTISYISFGAFGKAPEARRPLQGYKAELRFLSARLHGITRECQAASVGQPP